jgi:hypothetical protein
MEMRGIFHPVKPPNSNPAQKRSPNLLRPQRPSLDDHAMTTTALPALASIAPSKYRFSAVDDLQLPPALSVTTHTPLHRALTLALEREYSQLTVISAERKKLLGYLDVPATIHALETGTLETRAKGKEIGGVQGGVNGGEGGLSVGDVFTRFDRRKSLGYTVITPDTSLDVLDEFLQQHDFAIGTRVPPFGGFGGVDGGSYG